MVRKLIIAGIIAFASSANLAQAQFTTGPSTQNTPAPAPAPQGQQTLTEQSLVQVMQGLNLNPQEKLTPNGKFWTLQIRHADGWNFLVEIHPVKGKDGRLIGFIYQCPLGQPLSNDASAAQMRRILESVYKTAPCYFALQPGNNGRLCLLLESPYNTLSQQTLAAELDMLLRNVKATRDVWDINPPTAPAVTPVPAVAPAPAPSTPVYGAFPK